MTAQPEIAVVGVPSHNRPLRLRWLLNALEEQTLAPERWEVCIAHDSTDEETEELLRRHPLTVRGSLRHVRLPPAKKGSGGKLRNAAWRMARAPLIAFTDDDCYPPPDWLEQALASARRNPGAIVQGRTLPDPKEMLSEGRGPWPHTQHIQPPVPFAQACNIIYPRALLERVGGFVEDPPLDAGEDTDLALRARSTGAPYVGDREVLTFHAVESAVLPKRLRSLWRWQDLAWLVKTHPEMRDAFPLWVFWKRSHVWFPLAAAALVLERRNPLFAVLAIPWLVHATPIRGPDPRGRIRELSEVPGRAAIDITEMAALAWGSLKYRTFLI